MALTLESLKPKRSTKPPRIIFFAVPKFGKTTFASQAPNPVFIQAEEGEGDLELAGSKVHSFDEIIEFIAFLAETEHDFKTVVVDTADEIERIMVKEVLKRTGKSSMKDITYGDGYVMVHELWQEVLRGLDYLRETKNMNVIILAHTAIRTLTPPDTDSYDRYTFALQDGKKTSVCVLLKGWADIILFGNYKTYTKKSESDDRVKALPGSERFIYTEERATHWGGNRYGLPYEIPFIAGEQWAAFEHFLKPKKAPPAPMPQAEIPASSENMF